MAILFLRDRTENYAAALFPDNRPTAILLTCKLTEKLPQTHLVEKLSPSV